MVELRVPGTWGNVPCQKGKPSGYWEAILDGAKAASNLLLFPLIKGRMKIFPRHLILAAAALVVVGPSAMRAGEFRSAQVDHVLFSKETLGLMDIEREKLANELAGYVSNLFAEKPGAKKGGAGDVDLGSRMLAVALQLQSRNRTALVVNFKLQRGLSTMPVETEHPPGVLADFLYVRSKLLMEQGGVDNELLAGYLLSFAVSLDPDNEDAIYDLEMRRLDGLPIDWELLYDSPGDRERQQSGAAESVAKSRAKKS
jgi:hypothetical protein